MYCTNALRGRAPAGAGSSAVELDRFVAEPLRMLSTGDGIWVNLPGTGYSGVGRVTESRQLITDFEVDEGEDRRPATEVLESAAEYQQRNENPDEAEYYVRIEWLDTKPESEAVREAFFFLQIRTPYADLRQLSGRTPASG